jgi:hypothetical protein
MYILSSLLAKFYNIDIVFSSEKISGIFREIIFYSYRITFPFLIAVYILKSNHSNKIFLLTLFAMVATVAITESRIPIFFIGVPLGYKLLTRKEKVISKFNKNIFTLIFFGFLIFIFVFISFYRGFANLHQTEISEITDTEKFSIASNEVLSSMFYTFTSQHLINMYRGSKIKSQSTKGEIYSKPSGEIASNTKGIWFYDWLTLPLSRLTSGYDLLAPYKWDIDKKIIPYLILNRFFGLTLRNYNFSADMANLFGYTPTGLGAMQSLNPTGIFLGIFYSGYIGIAALILSLSFIFLFIEMSTAQLIFTLQLSENDGVILKLMLTIIWFWVHPRLIIVLCCILLLVNFVKYLTILKTKPKYESS